MPDFGEYNSLFDDQPIETPQVEPASDFGEYSALFDETPVEAPQAEIVPQVTPQGSVGRDTITPSIVSTSQKFGIDPSLVMALTEQESAYDPNAISRVGATGLMQIMPATAKEIAGELGVTDYDLKDPETNIQFGTYYLKKMLDKYDGDVEKALAAYNAGPGAVDKYNGIPPFKETQDYVKKIKERQGKHTGLQQPVDYSSLFDEDVTEAPSQTIEFEQPAEEKGVLATLGDNFVNTLKRQPKNTIRGIFSGKDAYKKRWDDAVSGTSDKIKELEARKKRLQAKIQGDFSDKTKALALDNVAKVEEQLKEAKNILKGLKEGKKETSSILTAYDRIVEGVEKTPVLEEVPTRDLEGVAGFAQDLSGAMAELVGSVATGIATGAAAPILMGARISGAQQEELEAAGVEPDKRAALGFANAIVQAPLEALGSGMTSEFVEGAVKKYVGSKIANKAITGFILEGATEFVQKYPEAVTNYIGIKDAAKTPEEKEKIIFDILDVTKAAAYEGLLGGLTGGVAGTIGGTIESITDKGVTEDVEEQIEETIEPKQELQETTDLKQDEQADEKTVKETVAFAEDFDNVEDFNKAIQDNLDEGNVSTVKALMRNLTEDERTELKSLRETAKQDVIEEVVDKPTPEVTEEVKVPEEAPKKAEEPDAAQKDLEAFEKWQIAKIEKETEGMEELGRVNWILDHGAELRAEYDQLVDEGKLETPVEEKPKRRAKVKLKKKTPITELVEKEVKRESTNKKIAKLENIRDNLVEFNQKDHGSLLALGLVEKETGDGKTYVNLTPEGSDRIGVLQTGFNRGKVSVDRLKTFDDELQKVADFDTEQVDVGFKNLLDVDDLGELASNEDFIDSYHTIGRQKKTPAGKAEVQNITNMFDSIKKQFPDGKLILRFGDEKNPIVNYKGEIIEDFKDGDYGGIRVNGNGDGLIVINTGTKDNNIPYTLVHEAIGHYGTDIILKMDNKLEKAYKDLYKRSKNTELVKELKDLYDENQVFDEWVANVTQDVLTPVFNKDGSINQDKLNNLDADTRNVFQKLVDFVKRVFGGKPTDLEIGQAVKKVFTGLSKITVDDTKKVDTVTKRQKATSEQKKQKTIEKAQKDTKERKKVKTKLRTFRDDLVKAQTATDTNKAKVRYTAFAERNLTSSQRSQLLEVVNKIKKADNTDPNYVKTNRLIDEFHHFRSVSKFEKDFKSIDRKGKITEKFDEIKDQHDSIEKTFERLQDFETLHRLDQRVEVRRPFKKGTEELTEMSDRYARLHKDGYILNDVVRKGITYYKLTSKGKARLSELRLANEESLDKLDSKVMEYRLAVQDKKDELSGKKKQKQEAAQKALNEGLDSVKEFRKRMKFTNKQMRGYINFFQSNPVHTAARIDGFGNIDEIGVQKGGITDNLIEVGKQGQKEEWKYLSDAQEFVTTEMEKESKKEGVDVDVSKFSESAHYGFVDKGLALLGHIPIVKRAIDGRIGRGRIKKFVYKFEDGSVQLNKAQRVSIYLHSLNNDARRHMIQGGIKLKKEETPVKLTQAEIEQVANDVRQSPDEMIVAKTVFRFYNKFQKEILNEKSVELNGYEVATVDNYFPIIVAPETIQKVMEGFKDVKDFQKFKSDMQTFIRETTPGFTKSRVESSKPIYIEDVFQTLARNTSVVAKFIGFGGKIEQMSNFIEGMKQPMIESGMESDFNNLKSFVASYMEGTGNKGEQFMRKLIGMYSVKVLGLNPKVALKQFPSLFAAFPYLDRKAWNVKMSPKKLKDSMKEMTERSIYINHRKHGVIEGDMLETYTEREARNWMGTKKGLTDHVSAEGFMSPIAGMDFAVIANIWEMVKKDIEVTQPDVKVGSDEYWDLVNRKSEYIIIETQPTFERWSRTRAQKTLALKPMTWFSTQRVKYGQQLEKGMTLLLDKKQSKEMRLRGAGLIANVALVNNLSMMLIAWGWMQATGKDKDKEDERRHSLLIEAIRNLTGIVAGVDFAVNNVINNMEGFKGIDAPGFQIVEDLAEFVVSLKKLTEKERRRSLRAKRKSKGQKALEAGADVIGDLGVPTPAVENAIKIYNNFIEELDLE